MTQPKVFTPVKNTNHGLSSVHLDIIVSILNPYAQVITAVGVFGSRATGNFHDRSDIDLVLHSSLSEAQVSCLWTLFNESSLPYKVDVVSYEHIDYPPLKAHIDQVEKTLLMLSGNKGNA